MKSAAIIILAYNKAPYVARCLKSLLTVSWRPLRVHLVDNGSTDEVPLVLEWFAREAAAGGISCDILRFPENRGAIVARNAAFERVDAHYVALLDSDVTVRTRSWIERMVACLESDTACGIVGPKLVYPFPPFLIQCAGCSVSTGGRVDFLGRGEPRDDPRFNRRREVQALISACWLMPASLMREVGPMDERFSPVQYEDIDYCYRVRDLGRTCVYLPDVEMYHFENVTTAGSPDLNYRYLTVKNNMKFQEKWRHRFSAEGGPPDSEFRWKEIPTVGLEEIGELDMLP
ncbi:MAG: glycosyltransferase family 2 protein [Planctomycetota bacterium]|nr:glycosyltransferase family 2 protein [Planctomycetota bacterium]